MDAQILLLVDSFGDMAEVAAMYDGWGEKERERENEGSSEKN